MTNYFGYAFTSYAGNLGYFPQYPREFDYPKGSSQWQTIQGQTNGTIYYYSNTKIADITDGTSNTMLWGEHAHGLLSQADRMCYFWWISGIRQPQGKSGTGRTGGLRCRVSILRCRLQQHAPGRGELHLLRRIGEIHQGLDRPVAAHPGFGPFVNPCGSDSTERGLPESQPKLDTQSRHQGRRLPGPLLPKPGRGHQRRLVLIGPSIELRAR